jgi:RadC-like JAB domain
LARYGADALTVEEHLALLVGGEILAAQMLKYFGSILALSRGSLCELRKFLPKRKAESLIAALRVSAYGEAKHALSEPLNRPEIVYSACLDMHMFNQEVLRVLLLNARFRLITSSDVCRGTLNESVAHPREIFSPRYRPFGLCFGSCTQPSIRRSVAFRSRPAAHPQNSRSRQNPSTAIDRSRYHWLAGSGPEQLFQFQGGRRHFLTTFLSFSRLAITR